MQASFAGRQKGEMHDAHIRRGRRHVVRLRRLPPFTPFTANIFHDGLKRVIFTVSCRLEWRRFSHCLFHADFASVLLAYFAMYV